MGLRNAPNHNIVFIDKVEEKRFFKLTNKLASVCSANICVAGRKMPKQ